MAEPPDPRNYWVDKQNARRRVRTQAQRGAGRRTGTRGQQAPSRRRGHDPGPPPGRGRLEGTTHRVRRGPSVGQRVARRLRPRARRRPNIRRMMRGGPLTLAWGTVSLLLTTVLLIAQFGAWWAYSATSLGVTTAVGVIEARRGRATVPPATRRPANSRSRTDGTSGGGSGGSPARPKRKPPGRTSTGSGKRTCSENCKRSPKPKSTCRCRASDCAHGSLAGGPP